MNAVTPSRETCDASPPPKNGGFAGVTPRAAFRGVFKHFIGQKTSIYILEAIYMPAYCILCICPLWQLRDSSRHSRHISKSAIFSRHKQPSQIRERRHKASQEASAERQMLRCTGVRSA